MRDDMTPIYETIASIQRKEAEKRERNHSLMKSWRPDFYLAIGQLKERGMFGKMVMFHVKHPEAA